MLKPIPAFREYKFQSANCAAGVNTRSIITDVKQGYVAYHAVLRYGTVVPQQAALPSDARSHAR